MNSKTNKNLDTQLTPCYPDHSTDEKQKTFSAVPTRKGESLFDKRIWRIDDVAQFLGCSVGHIYNLSSDEKIPKIKKGKFLFFIPGEILEWVLQGDFKNE